MRLEATRPLLGMGGRGCVCTEPVWSIDWEATRERRALLMRPGACAAPRLMRCSRCSGVCWAQCGATRDDRCEPCGPKPDRRLKRLIGSGPTVGRPGSTFARRRLRGLRVGFRSIRLCAW